MSKKTVKAFVYMRNEFVFDVDSGSFRAWKPTFYPFKVADDKDTVFISEQMIEVEVPDDFDPVPGQVAALEKAKRDALAAYQSKVAEINDELSKLQAITHTPEAA